jgi:hypothetical protein
LAEYRPDLILPLSDSTDHQRFPSWEQHTVRDANSAGARASIEEMELPTSVSRFHLRFRDQVEVKMRDFLSFTAVYDQSISPGFKVESADQGLDRFEQTHHENIILQGKVEQGIVLSLGDNQDVGRVGGCGMMKGEKRRRLDESIDGQGEAEVAEDPIQQDAAQPDLREPVQKPPHRQKISSRSRGLFIDLPVSSGGRECDALFHARSHLSMKPHRFPETLELEHDRSKISMQSTLMRIRVYRQR